jgi:membrane-bound lytic murein transglycosylase D
MLKTKISKAGFLGHGLLLLVPNGTTLKADTSESKGGLISALHFNAGTAISDTSDLGSVAIDSSGSATSIGSYAGMSAVATPKIPLNQQASKFVKSYLHRERESLVKIKGRSAPYFKIIDSVFTKYRLPLQLKYLAVIESELKPDARSHVGAKGPWQLMAQTGRDYGLKVTKKNDERTSYYKSTVVAAKYLRGLYAEFGDWLLVVAAYNGGSGTVEQAIKKSGSRNFWVLQHFLPAETRAHVKRFIGAHYYFEGEGSLITMTKSEAADYKKALADFEEASKTRKSDTIKTDPHEGVVDPEPDKEIARTSGDIKKSKLK